MTAEERKIDSKNIVYLDSYNEFTDYEKLMFEKLVDEQEQTDKAFGMLEKYFRVEEKLFSWEFQVVLRRLL